jgi:hypothetical protein
VVSFVLNALLSHAALAWGDEGHEVVAFIAQAYLDPAVRTKVNALLAADTDSLTEHDIAAEATWADKYRDANENGGRRKTELWHYVDIEIAAPDIDRACFGHPPVPPGQPASHGPAKDCVVDKIQEFAAELSDPGTPPEEQVVALKFLLHFVGDLHQPLHAADDEDRGGNEKKVTASGFKVGNLHHYWDTEFVSRLGPDAKRIAPDLIERISQARVRDWSNGEPRDWALESFQVAKKDLMGGSQSPALEERTGCPPITLRCQSRMWQRS